MATMACPHCGKEIYDMLDRCPHCGGPVMSDKLRAAREAENEANEKRNQEEYNALVKLYNKKELKWFAISILIAFLFAFFNNSVEFSIEVGKLITWYVFSAVIYGGFVYTRAFKRVGYILGLPYGVLAGVLGGVLFIFPRAVIRLIIKRRLLSEKDIAERIDLDIDP